jgi:hypothetical protein
VDLHFSGLTASQPTEYLWRIDASFAGRLAAAWIYDAAPG